MWKEAQKPSFLCLVCRTGRTESVHHGSEASTQAVCMSEDKMSC